jgi:hypothetical protein
VRGLGEEYASAEVGIVAIFFLISYFSTFRRVLHDHEHEWDELMEVWPQQWVGYTVGVGEIASSFAPS